MSTPTQRRKVARQPASKPIQAGGRQQWITIRGVTRRLSEVADSVPMNRKTLTSRIERGMKPEDAINLARFPLKAHSTPEEVMARRTTMLEVIEPLVPVTVRQIYYQMFVHHPDLIAHDTDGGYDMTASDMKWLREKGRLPYEDVVDNTRRVIEGYAYGSVAEALDELVDNYRPDIWRDMPCLVKFGIEKDALAGTLETLTVHYSVPLLVVRGYSSLSFLHSEALKIRNEERPIFFYHLGDHDGEGRDACRFTEEKLREFAPTRTSPSRHSPSKTRSRLPNLVLRHSRPGRKAAAVRRGAIRFAPNLMLSSPMFCGQWWSRRSTDT